MTPNVPDGEHAKNVASLGRDMSLVVRDIDGDEDDACESGNGKEKPTEKAEEAEENNGIEANFVDEVRFFGMNEWWDPREKTIRNWRGLFVANMIFNLWLVYHLREYKDIKTQEPVTAKPCYEDG